MKRQKIQLLTILILLIAMAAAYVGVKYYNNNHEEEDEKVSYTVTHDDAASVKSLSLANDNGELSFTKEGDIWYENSDKTVSIDAGALEDMIEAAVSITSEDVIENAADMSQYGLDEPEITVTYTTENASTTLEIGDYNSSVSKYYVCVKGENMVYTMTSSARASFTKSLDDLKKIETQGDESVETDGD
ncbi:uncharacterized protein DUF4340 [Kineothrix alysoides]|uniref:Uncharacterized protein DUF4340 n=1 Tax=Kineothrix alysoides TaxID=1469948 RepID=A0A4R1R021_9FIRM|nr:DUF4340 domain-containing protein [Kineothrix alysoides]TCL58599.1 uncharacterized protein DUF4340 [Kineothrix alysoides]